jgi:hypothetical protein
VVIVRGRIVEEGGHEELLAKKGEYHKLYAMQFEENDHSLPGVGISVSQEPDPAMEERG